MATGRERRENRSAEHYADGVVIDVEPPVESAPVPVSVSGKIGDSWALDVPLTLFVERELDGWYVISDEQFHMYGDGATFREALEDYLSTLIDQHRFLSREAQTNPMAVEHWQHMQKHLRQIPA